MTQLLNDLMTKKSYKLPKGLFGINSATGADRTDAGKAYYPLFGC